MTVTLFHFSGMGMSWMAFTVAGFGVHSIFFVKTAS